MIFANSVYHRPLTTSTYISYCPSLIFKAEGKAGSTLRSLRPQPINGFTNQMKVISTSQNVPQSIPNNPKSQLFKRSRMELLGRQHIDTETA